MTPLRSEKGSSSEALLILILALFFVLWLSYKFLEDPVRDQIYRNDPALAVTSEQPIGAVKWVNGSRVNTGTWELAVHSDDPAFLTGDALSIKVFQEDPESDRLCSENFCYQIKARRQLSESDDTRRNGGNEKSG